MIWDKFGKIEWELMKMTVVADKIIDYKEFSPDEGMLRGKLLFIDGSVLEFVEYLSREERLRYRFHLMNKDGKMIFHT